MLIIPLFCDARSLRQHTYYTAVALLLRKGKTVSGVQQDSSPRETEDL